MEAIAILGGVAALGQITGTVAKYAEMLYRASRKAGKLAEEVEDFAGHIQIFGSTVSGAHNTIRDHYRKDNESLSLRRMEKHDTLKTLASQSKRLMRRVKKLHPGLKEQQSSIALWRRIQKRWRWQKQKDEMNDICMWMDRVQQHFLLIMQGINYEKLQERLTDPRSTREELDSLRHEFKTLQRLMRTTLKSIQVTKVRQERLGHQEYNHQDEMHANTFNKVERDLVDFGQTISRDDGFSGSTMFSLTTQSRSSDETGILRERSRYRPDVRVPAEPFLALRTPPDSTSSLSPNENPRVQGPAQRQYVDRAGASSSNHREVERTTPASPSSSTSLPSENTQEDTDHDEVMISDEGDYMAVQASESIIRLDPDLNSQVLQGYIDSGQVPTNVLINPEFPQNVISERRATQLGLEIEYFRDDNNIEGEYREHLPGNGETGIDFGGGNIHLVRGRVKFRWGNGQKATHLRTFKMTCLVCEYVPFQPDVVFGQLFLNRRRHYWDQ